MAADNVCKADTAYYNINNVVHGQHKSVWLVVRGDPLYQEKEPGNLHNNFAVAIIKELMDIGPHSTALFESMRSGGLYETDYM